MSRAQYLHLFKVVLVGNSCVGKSSIVIRYADNDFSDVFLATIGVDFRFKAFNLNGESVKLQIWDTAGQQKFRTITSSYYRGAHALMIVFDITDVQSFKDATSYWFQEIKQSCPPQTQILLVGNKSDLHNMRKVTVEDVEIFLSSNPEVRYIEASAKTADNVEDAFRKIAEMLLQFEAVSQQSNRKGKPKKKQETQQLVSAKQEQKSRKYCCQR